MLDQIINEIFALNFPLPAIKKTGDVYHYDNIEAEKVVRISEYSLEEALLKYKIFAEENLQFFKKLYAYGNQEIRIDTRYWPAKYPNWTMFNLLEKKQIIKAEIDYFMMNLSVESTLRNLYWELLPIEKTEKNIERHGG